MDTNINICRVCNKSMSDPRILPCAHSFCLKCLETSTISKESSKCPTCQMDFEIPQGGLKDLKKNEFISKLHEIQQDSSDKESCGVCNENQAIRFCVDCSVNLCAKCLNCHKHFQGAKDHQLKAIKRKLENENISKLYELKHNLEICNYCDKNQAVKFCVDCPYNYCLSCLGYHQNIPATRNHKIIDIDAKQRKAQDDKKNYEVCEDHGEIKNLFCYDCNNILCALCFGLKHNGHKIVHVSQYADEMVKKLKNDINAKDLILQNILCNHESSENYKNERRANEVKKEIEKRGEEMKKNIDSVVEELKKNVDERLKKYNKEADDVLNKLQNLNKNINTHIKTLKQQLNDLKDKMFIEMDTLKDKFENIPRYGEYFDLTLTYNNIGNEVKSIFGKIISNKDGKAETTYRFTVNINELTPSINHLYSSEFYVRHLPWKLIIDPYKITQDADSKEYLGLFLCCSMNSILQGWSCDAKYNLKLLSNKHGGKLIDFSFSCNFDGKTNNWGTNKFVKMDELLDPNKGYVKDGSVTFEVYVKADEPKGV